MGGFVDFIIRLWQADFFLIQTADNFHRRYRGRRLRFLFDAGQKSHRLPLFDQQPENDIALLIADVNDARGFRFHRDSE
jgi:hypothetical protein